VKKMILLASGLAVLVTGIYCASLLAQGTTTPPANTLAAPTGTKVGVVNVGYVFSNWNKAKRLKQELEHAAEPFNRDAKKLQEEMAKWETEVRTTPAMPKQDVEIRQEAIKKNKRELEDLANRMRKVLGKKSEDDLVMLWKESKQCIDKVSQHYGFSIVFGYGDPLDPALKELFPNVNRLMNAMDGGATVPLYVHGSSDLSDPVARTLNQWDEYRQKQATGSK
jgi:Skp family chaperone for outer membrane proteins